MAVALAREKSSSPRYPTNLDSGILCLVKKICRLLEFHLAGHHRYPQYLSALLFVENGTRQKYDRLDVRREDFASKQVPDQLISQGIFPLHQKERS